jgi:outer membrane protein assembly factor BamB
MLSPATSENGQIVIEKVKDGVMNRLWTEIDTQHGDRDGRVSNAEWDKAFGSTSGFGGLALLRLGGGGDLTKSNVRWRVKRSFSYVTSPLLYENVIYIVNNGGIVSTINPQTGETFQQGRLKEAMEPYYASPVAGDGKVYFVSENAKVTVVKAGPKWEILATNDLGERCLSTPAIADGRLFIRTKELLYCFRRSS